MRNASRLVLDLQAERSAARLIKPYQGLWRQEQCKAFTAADRNRPVLAHGRSTSLSSVRTPARSGKTDECRRQRAVRGACGGRIKRGAHSCVRRQYHYNFWRSITSIRNGDIDGNPATDREATWQPIDNTPMHPEYPCAHCILSGTVSGVIKAALGTVDIPEIAITSATASGVAHRWPTYGLYRRGCKWSHLGRLPLPISQLASARIWGSRSANTL